MEILRRAVKLHPDRIEEELAAALQIHATRLHETGNAREAVVAYEESASVFRRLAKPSIRADVMLAGTLGALGGLYSEMNQPKLALRASQEAADVVMRLSDVHTEAFAPDLVSSLINLSAHLAWHGQRERAHEVAVRVMDLVGQLAVNDPARYEATLSRALMSLGSTHAMLGRDNEAVIPTRRAVEIQRNLANANPREFEPQLARSLTNLAANLSGLEQYADARVAVDEAVGIFRRLANSEPTEFELYLAKTLHASAVVRVCERNDWDRARVEVEEALGIYRRWDERLPSEFSSEPPRVQGTLAHVLEGLGEYEEARKIRRWLKARTLGELDEQ